jgi:hypothetical protein
MKPSTSAEARASEAWEPGYVERVLTWPYGFLNRAGDCESEPASKVCQSSCRSSVVRLNREVSRSINAYEIDLSPKEG